MQPLPTRPVSLTICTQIQTDSSFRSSQDLCGCGTLYKLISYTVYIEFKIVRTFITTMPTCSHSVISRFAPCSDKQDPCSAWISTPCYVYNIMQNMNGVVLPVCTVLGTLMLMFIHLYCMTGLMCHSSACLK